MYGNFKDSPILILILNFKNVRFPVIKLPSFFFHQYLLKPQRYNEVNSLEIL